MASFPFTTLRPHLGTLHCEDGNSLVIADIPGLIQGASQAKGLGHDFLRHIERTGALAYVVDLSGGSEVSLEALSPGRQLQLLKVTPADTHDVVSMQHQLLKQLSSNLSMYAGRTECFLQGATATASHCSGKQGGSSSWMVTQSPLGTVVSLGKALGSPVTVSPLVKASGPSCKHLVPAEEVRFLSIPRRPLPFTYTSACYIHCLVAVPCSMLHHTTCYLGMF